MFEWSLSTIGTIVVTHFIVFFGFLYHLGKDIRRIWDKLEDIERKLGHIS